MTEGLRVSRQRAITIGWTMLSGPVATAIYSLTIGGNPVLLIVGILLACAAFLLLAVGYRWVVIGSGIRVEPDESTRIDALEDKARGGDVRSIDVLVTQCVSVRWFVRNMANRGKEVRLLVYDPNLTRDTTQRERCIHSLHDIVDDLSEKALKRIEVRAYNLTPSVRALILRDAGDTPLYALLGWYSHRASGIGGSRYPALVFGGQGRDEQLLMSFADSEVRKMLGVGRVLSRDEIIQLFESLKDTPHGSMTPQSSAKESK
jgi:hypothetical protein